MTKKIDKSKLRKLYLVFQTSVFPLCLLADDNDINVTMPINQSCNTGNSASFNEITGWLGVNWLSWIDFDRSKDQPMHLTNYRFIQR